MEPLFKQALEEGRRLAEEDHKKQLEQALKKREAFVGWKETSVAPKRLSSSSA